MVLVTTVNCGATPELTSEEFHQSITDATLKPYKKDETIFKAGDEDGFYLMRSGTVKIIKKRADGQEYVVTFLHVGSYFGEIALLTEETGKRNATVMAATNVELSLLGQAGIFWSCYAKTIPACGEYGAKRNSAIWKRSSSSKRRNKSTV